MVELRAVPPTDTNPEHSKQQRTTRFAGENGAASNRRHPASREMITFEALADIECCIACLINENHQSLGHLDHFAILPKNYRCMSKSTGKHLSTPRTQINETHYNCISLQANTLPGHLTYAQDTPSHTYKTNHCSLQ